MARREGPGGFAVAGRLGEVDLGTGTAPDAPERRQVRVNGAPASANSLSEWLSVLWLTPAMDRLFADAASGRRRFLDRLVLALRPDHATHSARYEAAMRARNKLLAEDGPWDEAWLDRARSADGGAWAAIAAARAGDDQALTERLADGGSDFPKSRASISPIDGGKTRNSAEAPAGRARDAAAGAQLPARTIAPISSSPISAREQPAALCSTGEQKALLIGLILAHADLVAAHTGRRPILLLDEIAAHLDPTRRAALFERLGGAGGQVWMTGTERRLFDGVGDATWLGVEAGTIIPG